jgi:hypothetical protein
LSTLTTAPGLGLAMPFVLDNIGKILSNTVRGLIEGGLEFKVRGKRKCDKLRLAFK